MEEKTRSSTQNALFYGLITGVIIVVYSLILYITNQYMNKILSYCSYVLVVAVMFWGTLEYRKTYMNGFMSYGKAFSSCFMIGLFCSIVGAVYMLIFAQFIYPGFTQEILDKARYGMLERSSQLTDEQIDQAMIWTKRFTTPVMMAIWSLIVNLFFSVFFALIISIFLRREDKSVTNIM